MLDTVIFIYPNTSINSSSVTLSLLNLSFINPRKIEVFENKID